MSPIKKRVEMPSQEPSIRIHNFREVNLGLEPHQAQAEAARCLQCRRPLCVEGCPVNVNIPEFIRLGAQGRWAEALSAIKKTNLFPGICGRVCPQEKQCEGACVLGKKGEPIAIGMLERFAADFGRSSGNQALSQAANPTDSTCDNVSGTGHKVAVIGSGPASMAAASELARYGHRVEMFEALHETGGVLIYGIPEFRLPKDIVRQEFAALQEMGVVVHTNVLVGRTLTLQDLWNQGFSAVFVGAGAGLPRFLGIPGEDLNGVYSANEFLTRVNLMRAYRFPEFETPVHVGRRVVVVGGGNTAMDAARTARRLGAEVTIVYRRSRSEMPARAEEIVHAEEEGIEFQLLTNPVEVLGQDGWVTAVRCQRMQLGDPGPDGRRLTVPVPDSEFDISADTFIVAIGQSPNPILRRTMPELRFSSSGTVEVDPETYETSIPGVFAAGDIISGGSTVIDAMGGGRKAAQSIDRYLKQTAAL